MLDIALYGDDILREKTEDIKEITPEIKKLVDNMFETMYANNGVGLAAPQVSQSLNLAIIDTSVGIDPESKLVLINPRIVKTKGSQFEEEGCLSFPQLIAPVERPEKTTVIYTDIEGNEKKITGEGLLAKALDHEIDHLKGILFIDHVRGLEKTMLVKRLKKLMATEPWQKVS
jgi:peptide deformylase